MHIYIYIQREREIDRYIYIYICIYTYVLQTVAIVARRVFDPSRNAGLHNFLSRVPLASVV